MLKTVCFIKSFKDYFPTMRGRAAAVRRPAVSPHQCACHQAGVDNQVTGSMRRIDAATRVECAVCGTVCNAPVNHPRLPADRAHARCADAQLGHAQNSTTADEISQNR